MKHIQRKMKEGTIQSVDAIPDECEYEYFEEEILSQYGTMLSTIVEGDDDESTYSNNNPLIDTSKRVVQSPELSIPGHIGLTPTNQRTSVEYSTKLLTVMSPLNFSPESHRPRRPPPSSSPSYDPSYTPPSWSPGRGKLPPKTQGIPMILTNLESGEEMILNV